MGYFSPCSAVKELEAGLFCMHAFCIYELNGTQIFVSLLILVLPERKSDTVQFLGNCECIELAGANLPNVNVPEPNSMKIKILFPHAALESSPFWYILLGVPAIAVFRCTITSKYSVN